MGSPGQMTEFAVGITSPAYKSIGSNGIDNNSEERSNNFERGGSLSDRSTSMLDQLRITPFKGSSLQIRRRGSHDEIPYKPETLIFEVESLLYQLLQQEDTDENEQITIDDTGPKTIRLRTLGSDGSRAVDIRGSYALSSILGALTSAKELKQSYLKVDSGLFLDSPTKRLSCLIADLFWNSLTRKLDKSMIDVAASDPKDWHENSRPRIYVPSSCSDQLNYYEQIATERPELRLEVMRLPENITSQVYKKMLEKPGILALAMEPGEKDPKTGRIELQGVPFVVPGGRFNELFYWDTYFCGLGLLSVGKTDLVKSLVKNFIFEIQHYGLIPNANRSYFLLRSQPPFLTSLAMRTYSKLPEEPASKDFLRQAILAAIKEYHQVWVTEPRLDPVSGLSRYRPLGFGIPLECEPDHFFNVLEPYMKKYGMTQEEFGKSYMNGEIDEPELDNYFLHDRGVRESGHDVSLRLEGCCADMATIDLNSLLYKYEIDIGNAIRTVFDGKLTVPKEFCAPGQIPDHVETPELWEERSKLRKERVDKYLWNEKHATYFDYNTKTQRQSSVESVTCFFALWSGLSSAKQAALMVEHTLPKFEKVGGLVTTTAASIPNGGVNVGCHDQHQWDYPYGWAPHQITAWDGLRAYGYTEAAQRCCYRWLRTITKVFVDFNGAVVEKYNVTNIRDPHKVDAEYGNQGLNFKGYAREGFGWTNASFSYGLELMSPSMVKALDLCAPFESYAKVVAESLGK